MKQHLIICGIVRSGTRMTTNILNSHPDVYITGEIPYGLYESLFVYFKSVDKYYSYYLNSPTKSWHKSKNWSNRKAEIIIDSWKNIVKGGVNYKRFLNANIIGNKTPYSEDFFEEFEYAFSENKPKYIFCARDAYQVMRSLKNMPWNKKTVEQNLERYLKSFEKFDKIFESCPERILRININNFNSDRYNFAKRIFDFLELKMDEKVTEKVCGLEKSNTMNQTHVKNSNNIQELSKEEIEIINNSIKYEKVKSIYF